MLNEVNTSVIKIQDTALEERRASILLKCFFERTDVIAVANPRTGKPLPIRSRDISALIHAHVAGEDVPKVTVIDQYMRSYSGHFRLGSYMSSISGCISLAVLDFDGGAGKKNPLKNPRGVALETYRRATTRGLVTYAERSGSGDGFHLWFFFRKPIPAAAVRKLLFGLVDGKFELAHGGFADPHRNIGIEVFPKQDSLRSDQIGNCVWLPWYFGRKSGCSEFVDLVDASLSVISPYEFLRNETSSLPSFKVANEVPGTAAKKTNSTSAEITNASDANLGDLTQLANACSTTMTLLHLCRHPQGKGMTHDQRLALAQIAKSVGLSDILVAQLFRLQPNFKPVESLKQVRSIRYLPSCRSLGARLGLCNGRCPAIAKINRGTPSALLESNKFDNTTTGSVHRA